MLADNTGVSGQNFTGTILDDDADVPIQSATTAGAPFSGRWKPAQPLSALDGKPLAGHMEAARTRPRLAGRRHA